MASGYVRQSSGVIINGGTINASDSNNEFNSLQSAFDATTGHTHDGTTGGGAKITSGGLAANAVALSNMATLTGLSVIGNMTNALATPTAITGAADQVLVVNSSGTSLAFGQIKLPAAVTGTLTVVNGGTSLASGTAGGILGFTGTTSIASSVALTLNQLVIGGGTTTPTPLGSLGTATTVLHGNATGIPSFGSITLTTDVSGTLPVANGGTGNATLTSHGVLIGAGTSAITQLVAAVTGTVLSGVSSADPAFTASPSLGAAGSNTGKILFNGVTGGTVTMQPQAAAGTYNFNLPTTAGSSGQVLTSTGGAASAMDWATITAGTGVASVNYTTGAITINTSKQLQVVSTQTGSLVTGSNTIPTDDTIPQITEGDEYMTKSITPKSASSTLFIEVVWNGSNNGGLAQVVALFQDSTANALAATAQVLSAANRETNIVLKFAMTSGTTSATTFRVRSGAETAATTTFNGTNGSRLFGGVFFSSITITEILP